VAGEANVPFYHISGSEFVEMFVGVGASRVRDLFNRAKKTAPCIIFIDEIDAVGRRRGAGLGGSHDEREQTLNQILVEMDGFDGETEIIVIAATNRPDVLDPALLRPGRFDRQVVLEIPDLKEREAILKVHSEKKPLTAEVDLKKIAERTAGFSGADLSNLLNEAAIATAKVNAKEIKMQTIFDSIEKVMIGPERKSRVITEREKKITAYHEAGHALVAHNLKNVDPIQKISIISRGRAAGYTLKTPQEDRRLHSKVEFVEELAVLVAGRMAEKMIFNDVTTGASADLRMATDLAKAIVTEYGMSDKLPLRTFGTSDELIFLGREMREGRDYSEKTSEAIDAEVGKLFDEAAKTAMEILNNKKADLEKIVSALLIK
jgi:cell division protease FtsH